VFSFVLKFEEAVKKELKKPVEAELQERGKLRGKRKRSLNHHHHHHHHVC
jgi:hypothetical protein